MFRKVAGYFTPAKSTVVDPCTPEFGVVEEVPSIYISKAGHIALGAIYSAFLFGYVAFLIWEWTERPYYYQYAQVDADEYPLSGLRLYVECTRPPLCGNLNVTVDYTIGGGAVPGGCAHLAPQRLWNIPAADTGASSPIATRGVDVTLCYTADPPFNTHTDVIMIPGVTVTFDNIQSTPTDASPVLGYARVAHVRRNGTEVPVRLVNLDRKQVKTLVLSQSVSLDDGAVVEALPAPVGIQYDGKHASNRATFFLAAAAYVDTINKWRGHWLTIIGTLGSCAMAAWVVFTIMCWLVPFWPRIFPSEAQALLTTRTTAPAPTTTAALRGKTV